MPIVIEHLKHSYSGLEIPAVNDVSLTIQEGEFIGIIGHTGSGKSTLLQHFNALLLPDSGSVTVDGYNSADRSNRKVIRSLVGMVFQYPEYQLFADTVREDIAFGPSKSGYSPIEINRRVRQAMDMVGLDYDTFSEKSPFDLSGGEKRRAALAGVLAMEPKYIVLDEPMAGLDPRGRYEIMSMLEALRMKTGCAIIMVSHSMDDMAAHADRILVLEHGSVRWFDSPGKVFSHGKELISMGLSLPEVTSLAFLLREKGITDIPENICTYEQMLTYLKERLSV